MFKTYIMHFLCLTALIATSCSSDEKVIVTPQRPTLSVAAAADSVKRAPRRQHRYSRHLPDKISSADQLKNFMRNSPEHDKYERGIIMRLADQSVEYTEKLLRSSYPYFIIVDKGTMKLHLYDRYGQEVKSCDIACSRYFGTKHKFRDNRTPEGFFYAEGVYESTEWLYTDDDGYTSPAKGVYGPRFIRLKTPVTRSVGIHGTNSPGSMTLRTSHGCIRVLNKNIVNIVKYVSKGTPIIVNPGSRDVEVNKEEGYNITRLNLTGSKAYDTEPDAKKDEKAENEANGNDKDIELNTSEASDTSTIRTAEDVKVSNPSTAEPDSLKVH